MQKTPSFLGGSESVGQEGESGRGTDRCATETVLDSNADEAETRLMDVNADPDGEGEVTNQNP